MHCMSVNVMYSVFIYMICVWFRATENVVIEDYVQVDASVFHVLFVKSRCLGSYPTSPG
jgi:hypothetical protein